VWAQQRFRLKLMKPLDQSSSSSSTSGSHVNVWKLKTDCWNATKSLCSHHAKSGLIRFRLSEAAVRGAVGEPRAVVGQPAGAQAGC
jgi:hypothetical protein